MQTVSPLSSFKPAVKRVTEAPPKKEEVGTSHSSSDHNTMIPLEPEPADSPIQRGFISMGRSERLKLQLWLADNLRKLIAPDIPLDLPLPRTPEREQIIRERYHQAVQRANIKIPPDVTPEQFYTNVLDEIFGFGPLEVLIKTDSVSEIMVNGPYIIFIEQKGKLIESGYKFLDDDHVERIIKRIVKPLGRLADAGHPLVDARLPDGSRVNAVLRPCAIDGPNITIRKFSRDKLTIEDLIRFNSLTPQIADFLKPAWCPG